MFRPSERPPARQGLQLGLLQDLFLDTLEVSDLLEGFVFTLFLRSVDRLKTSIVLQKELD